jgi:hypothetical protein
LDTGGYGETARASASVFVKWSSQAASSLLGRARGAKKSRLCKRSIFLFQSQTFSNSIFLYTRFGEAMLN